MKIYKNGMSKDFPMTVLSLLEEMDLQDFGNKILNCKGTVKTSYGVIYGKNMDLFSAITLQPEQEEIQEWNMETGMSL